MTHPDFPPQELRFNSETSWVLTPASFDHPPFRPVLLDGTEVKVVPDGNIGIPQSVEIDDVITTPEVESDPIGSIGAWEIDATTVTLGGGGYCKLQHSTDGGTVWNDEANITVAGTTNGTLGAGLARLVAFEGTYDVELTITTDVPSLSVGDTVTVEATSSIFDVGQIGSEVLVEHLASISEVRTSLSYTSYSPTLTVSKEWTLTTTGTWGGWLDVEKSEDSGATWELVISRAAFADRNISETGTVSKTVLMRIKYINAFTAPANSPHATLDTDGSPIKGRVEITGFTDDQNLVGVVTATVHSESFTEFWQEAAWSDYRGWPVSICWHESRIWYGGCVGAPSTMWGSQIDDFFNFEAGSNDSDSISKTLGSTTSSDIKWLASATSIYIGTQSEEWRGYSDSDIGVITPGSFITRRISSNGSDPVQPLYVKGSTIHVQREGRELLQISYDAASSSPDGYISKELNYLSKDITSGGIISTGLQVIRDTIVWCVTGDGKLLGLTFEPTQNVIGWHEHEAFGTFESVAVVYEEGSEDSVYVVMNVSGDLRIERMTIDQYAKLDEADETNSVFVDGAVTYDGAPATVISGLDHMDGFIVQIMADGVRVDDKTVTAGSITLDDAASKVVVGIGYDSILETLPFSFQDSTGRYKSVTECSMIVKGSVTANMAQTPSGTPVWENITASHRQASSVNPAPALNARGNIESWKVNSASRSDKLAALTIRINEPYPLNLLALNTTLKS
jgi:hypothetical protein